MGFNQPLSWLILHARAWQKALSKQALKQDLIALPISPVMSLLWRVISNSTKNWDMSWREFSRWIFSSNASRGVCSVATTKKRVKILDFKLFYKHFVFVDKGNFDIKKSPKKAHRCKCICRYRLRIGKMNTTINIYLKREQLYIVLLFDFQEEKWMA